MERKRKRRRRFGFTLTEVALVTTLVSAIPASQYVQVKNRAHQTKCLSNLRQVGQAIMVSQLTDGHYPKATFYPKKVTDKDSIVKVLKLDKRLFICPGLPGKFQDRGLTFIYNDTIAGAKRIKNPAKTWVLIEITCVSKKAPFPHPNGYNILYANGQVKTTKTLPPDIAAAQQSRIKQIEQDLMRQIEDFDSKSEVNYAHDHKHDHKHGHNH